MDNVIRLVIDPITGMLGRKPDMTEPLWYVKSSNGDVVAMAHTQYDALRLVHKYSYIPGIHAEKVM